MRISDWISDVCSSDFVGDVSTSLLADGGSCPADFATSGAFQPAGGRGDASDCLFDGAGCCLLASAAAPRRRNLEASDPVAEDRQRSVLAALIARSEEHTSELQSLMRISYAVFCLKKKKPHKP